MEALLHELDGLDLAVVHGDDRVVLHEDRELAMHVCREGHRLAVGIGDVQPADMAIAQRGELLRIVLGDRGFFLDQQARRHREAG